eukprot:TRINITY_DN20680_c0_g1_i1.p1 TRINITY_DN20680_c0_g1~~TRINITY_DN20680_c0_g1_i1.p1  ORF type:complete len:328 (+),score=25.02 TRINITY_DN20680_c0_g1_i1:33-1016(+)
MSDPPAKKVRVPKIIVITGANRGIGAAITLRLVRDHPGTHVVMGCRNVESGNALVKDTLSEWKDRVEVLEMDVTSDESVAKAAKIVQEQHKSIYGLINNAGIACDPPWDVTPKPNDTARKTLAINYYGVKTVCKHFLPLMQGYNNTEQKNETEPQDEEKKECSSSSTVRTQGRIVNVSSGVAGMDWPKMGDNLKKELTADDITPDTLDKIVERFIKTYEEQDQSTGAWPRCVCGFWMNTYSFSKMALNSYTSFLAKEQKNITTVCCSPGFVDTGMTASYGGTDWKKQTTDEGATTPTWLAITDDELTSGAYYREKTLTAYPPEPKPE